MSATEFHPSISVIVPVYDVEAYLPACLDSLLAQTFTDFEIVLVDDGSTDGSAAIIASYAEKHPDLIRTFAKPNGGLADARNFGMAHSRGEYYSFVDSDDIVAPEFLSAMHAAAEEDEADLVICGIVSFTDAARPDAYLPEPDPRVFGNSLQQEPRLLYRVDASACDKLYARDLFARAGISFPVGVAFEDVPTTYRLLAHARRVVKIDEPLYLYRQGRAGSITATYGDRFLDLVRGMELVCEFYQQRSDFSANRDALLRLLLTHLIAGRYPDFFLHSEKPARVRFLTDVFGLLDGVFPSWKRERVCADLWPNRLLRSISTDAQLLDAFCHLPAWVYIRLLARMGAFDPRR